MTAPRELVYELQERFGRLLLDHWFPLDDRGRLDLDHVRRACEQRVEIVQLAHRAVLARAAVRGLHGRRPRPPPRAGRSGSSAAARAASPRSTGSSTRRSGDLLDARARRDDGNVLVVSDHGGGSLDGVVNLNAWLEQRRLPRRTPTGRDTATTRWRRMLGHRLFELRRKAAEATCATRSSSACRGCASGRTGCAATRSSTGRGRARSPTGSFGNIVLNVRGRERFGIVEPGAEYERRARRDRRSASASCRRPRASAWSRRCTAARISSTAPSSRRSPTSSSSSADYAWLGKGNLTERTPDDLGPRHDPRPPEPDLRGQPPLRGHLRPGRAGGPAPAPSSTRGSWTSRRRCSTCSASRSRPTLEGRSARRGSRPRPARRAAARVRRRRDRRGRDAATTTTGRRRPRSRSGCAASATSSSRPRRGSRERQPRGVRSAAAAGTAGGVVPARRAARSSSSRSSTSVTSPARASRRAKSTWWSSTASPKRREPRARRPGACPPRAQS